ncbi:MAG: D-tyrosyl-tRNA(Tyr) deacylase [Oscillospiraceae bacterium]|jgi:D-tyrosyl-tRNA(Tyr) deacylase|nr:D-tyrosyl-tRNA(Tyr) deacylase [Oscillospiraceae bacterium]
MRVVLQRVLSASVEAEGKVTGSIGKGYVALLGVGKGDTRETAVKMAEKIARLRLFADSGGKTNLSAADVGGALLAVSQFTLYADCSKGHRPSFTGAAEPAEARALYEAFIAECKRLFGKVESGVFGADMKLSLVNDGPFTMCLEM